MFKLSEWLKRFETKRIVIYEYQRGLLFTNGRFERILDPGEHYYKSFYSRVDVIDMRLTSTIVAGQEVMTSDGISVRASLVLSYQVADPYLALVQGMSYSTEIYLQTQLALREAIASVTAEELIANRQSLKEPMMSFTQPKAQSLGVRLEAIEIRDLTFPGELKKIFSQVLQARQEGLAALERARGETAALRNLANAARLMKDNPALMQLRLLQTMTGKSSGNTLVVGVPGTPLPIPPAEQTTNPPAEGSE